MTNIIFNFAPTPNKDPRIQQHSQPAPTQNSSQKSHQKSRHFPTHPTNFGLSDRIFTSLYSNTSKLNIPFNSPAKQQLPSISSMPSHVPQNKSSICKDHSQKPSSSQVAICPYLFSHFFKQVLAIYLHFDHAWIS